MPGVYISYPFCTQKCSFCNFASSVASFDVRTRYEQVLLRELLSHSWDWVPETVYFGGGTPSLMPVDMLRKVMNAIPRQTLREVTLECAPGTLNPEIAEVWYESGINRVSLGVQSFATAELRQAGRKHTAEIVESDVTALRAAGIQNINIDLIAGLPRQSAKSWEESLDWVERLNPPHVSVYIFEVDEDSRLGKEVLLGGSRYGAQHIPDDELTVELYERAVVRLRLMGIQRYEISNFARPGWESRHNLKYWQLEPYIGFGLDAHSFDGRQRWSNPDTFQAYFEQHDGGNFDSHEGKSVDTSEEHFFVGLRLMNGIEPTTEEWSRFHTPIQKWLKAGMLERDGARLRLSERGILVSNEIFQEFIDGPSAMD